MKHPSSPPSSPTSSPPKRLIQLSWIPDRKVDADEDCDLCILVKNSPCEKDFELLLQYKSLSETQVNEIFDQFSVCVEKNSDLFSKRHDEIAKKLAPFFEESERLVSTKEKTESVFESFTNTQKNK